MPKPCTCVLCTTVEEFLTCGEVLNSYDYHWLSRPRGLLQTECPSGTIPEMYNQHPEEFVFHINGPMCDDRVLMCSSLD